MAGRKVGFCDFKRQSEQGKFILISRESKTRPLGSQSRPSTTRPNSPSALPKPPTNVLVSDVTPNTVHLSWNSGNIDPILAYVVQYRQKFSAPGVDFIEIKDIPTTECTVLGLSAHTTYQFRALAVNDTGRGLPSTPAEVMTGEQVPGSPPVNVRVRLVSSNTAVVQWEEPLIRNGIIRGYKIYYTLSPAEPISLWTVHQVEHPPLIVNLITNRNYTIRLLSFTSIGDGPLSEPIEVKTEQGEFAEDGSGSQREIFGNENHSHNDNSTSSVATFCYEDESDQDILRSSSHSSTSSSDTSVEESSGGFQFLYCLPIEIWERILLEAIVLEIKSSTLAKASRELKVNDMIGRFGDVCCLWQEIVSTPYFFNTVSKAVSHIDEDQIHLQVVRKTEMTTSVQAMAVVNNTLFTLNVGRPGLQHVLNVFENMDLSTIKHFIPVRASGPVDISGCNLKHTLYLLSCTVFETSVSRYVKQSEHGFEISSFIRLPYLENPALSTMADGNILVSSQHSSSPAVVFVYNANGYFQHKIMAPDSNDLLCIIPKPNGKLVFVSRNLQIGTQLTEVDMYGDVQMLYQTVLKTNGYSLVDKQGTIILTSRLRRIEVIDKYLNLIASNSPQLDADQTGFTRLDEDFMPLQNIHTRILLQQAKCHNLLSFSEATSELIWLTCDRENKANFFTCFHAERR